MSRGFKLVHGVGINDANYIVETREILHNCEPTLAGRQKSRSIWRCPYHSKWSSLLDRCYSNKSKEKNPSYRDCFVSEEWLTFSNFRAWMVEQDFDGLHLDKDLLISGNKLYSSETCIFLTRQVNNFLVERSSCRGEWPIGVYWNKERGKFQAQCNNPFTKKCEYLGKFDCPQQAHKAWLAKKLEHAYALAAIQTDTRVAKALIYRYENYKVLNGYYRRSGVKEVVNNINK